MNKAITQEETMLKQDKSVNIRTNTDYNNNIKDLCHVSEGAREFLSKEEVEKRVKAWKRTTLVRKRSES